MPGIVLIERNDCKSLCISSYYLRKRGKKIEKFEINNEFKQIVNSYVTFLGVEIDEYLKFDTQNNQKKGAEPS